MTSGRVAGLALCLLIALTYVYDLGRTPVYFGGDEAHFAVIGQRLAETGRNLKGDLLPLFIRLDDPQGPPEDLPWGTTWYQPMLFYAVAVVLKLLPLSIAAVRLPLAILGGVINPLLMYFVGARMFKRRDLAFLSAVILLLSPPLVILGRQALDYALPVTFILAWLWLLLAYTDTGRLRLAFFSGLVLGVGCYSYIPSWAMMPGYLGLSWLIMWNRRADGWRAIGWSAVGFFIPVVLVLPWLWAHPTAFHEIVQRYRVAEDGGTSVLSNRVNLKGLASLVSIYWDYFDPAYLFLTGGPSMTTSTGRVGVFLIPIAIWLPAGLYALVANRANWKWSVVLAAGLFAAPLPAVLRGIPDMVQRELMIFPFAVLICGHGLALAMRSRHAVARWCGAITVAVMVLQYGVFVHDYWTHYKRRSAFYYDPAAFSEIANVIFSVERARAIPAVYFGADIDDVGAKWRFFTTAEGREGLMDRTRYVADPWSVADAVPGSLLVVYDERLKVQALVDGGRWKVVEVVADFDQRTTAVVLTRLESFRRER
ncbi:MAG: glycosyltransferase family 39 protein [Vicinamibacterales bacterium]